MILGEGERERERKRKRGKTGNKKEKRERENPEKTAGQLVGLVVCAGGSCEQSPRTKPFNSPQLRDGVCLQEHTVHKQKSRCFSFFCIPFLLESFSLLALPSVRSLCSASADSALLLTEASDDGGWPEELLCIVDRVQVYRCGLQTPLSGPAWGGRAWSQSSRENRTARSQPEKESIRQLFSRAQPPATHCSSSSCCCC